MGTARVSLRYKSHRSVGGKGDGREIGGDVEDLSLAEGRVRMHPLLEVEEVIKWAVEGHRVLRFAHAGEAATLEQPPVSACNRSNMSNQD